MTLPFCLIGKCQQGPMCQYYVQMPVMIRETGNYHYRALELDNLWLLKKKYFKNTFKETFRFSFIPDLSSVFFRKK